MARVLLPVGILLLGAAVAVMALRGGGGDGTDQKDPMAVFRRTMEAVHDADWPTLQGLLTKEARLEMERDLTRLKRRLAHPEDGSIERALARQRLGDGDAEAIRRVVEGGFADALWFYVQIMPRERSPAPHGMEAQAFERRILYAATDGTLRPVRLVLVHDAWFVADLQL